MWLIAGPNGSGKSTYAPNLTSVVEEIVRPDELAYELSPDKPESVALKAGRLAINRIESLLEQKRSSAVETTLSGRFHLDAAQRAKSGGWNVGIVYIGLSSPTVAMKRVLLRKLRGGHYVPPEDVRRRYRRSLANLAVISKIADRLVVLDNSSSRTPMKRLFETDRGQIVFRHRSLPKWLIGALNPILTSRPKR
ncbi:zeta toxin family protein [Candidatus Binatus sp.]|uniref:zeta toxin family protein n=1 Tax=Candidatus Binatus sp. TaxID=2811406 RepID=UPI003C784FA2